MAGQPAAERTRDDAGEQRQAAGDSRDVLRVAARAMEQRHDPVADDHREPERRGVHRRQRQQPPVGDPRQHARAAPAAPARAAPGRRAAHPASATITAVANGACHVPHSGTSASARPTAPTLQAPYRPCANGRADRLADVVAARHERRGGADSDDRPHADREPRLAPRECGRRARRHDQQPAAADEPRADPVAEPARRHLQQRVRDEERRREQADHRQPDAVRMRPRSRRRRRRSPGSSRRWRRVQPRRAPPAHASRDPMCVLVREVPGAQRAWLEADHDVVGEVRDVGLAGLDAEIADGDLPRGLVGSLRNERRPRSQLDAAVGRRVLVDEERGASVAAAGAAPSRRRCRSRRRSRRPASGATPATGAPHRPSGTWRARQPAGCSSRSPRSAGSSPLRIAAILRGCA